MCWCERPEKHFVSTGPCELQWCQWFADDNIHLRPSITRLGAKTPLMMAGLEGKRLTKHAEHS